MGELKLYKPEKYCSCGKSGCINECKKKWWCVKCWQEKKYKEKEKEHG